VLRPDAGVDDADDHVRRSVVLSTEARPDSGGADEVSGVAERLLERVALDGSDARDIE